MRAHVITACIIRLMTVMRLYRPKGRNGEGREKNRCMKGRVLTEEKVHLREKEKQRVMMGWTDPEAGGVCGE